MQGITEFLPVSSDGHLALAELLFGVHGGGLTLTIVLHAGTLLATALVLWSSAKAMVLEGARALLRPSRFRATSAGRDAWVVLLATLPTGVIGLLLRDAVERWTSSPLVVGLGFLVTAVSLASTRWAKPGRLEVPGALGALLIGVAQGLAVLPGVSRSGSTITLALWLGVKRERAFELSMLMSLPSVLGAVALESVKLLRQGMDGLGVALLGALVAFVVGLGALLLVRGVVVRGWFHAFALWVFPVSLATLALAYAWP